MGFANDEHIEEHVSNVTKELGEWRGRVCFCPVQHTLTCCDDILKTSGLTRVSDTIVGNEKVRGVSGGERKRVSIAIELISDPSVLFLGKPVVTHPIHPSIR